MALFSGAFLGRRAMAFAAPLGALLLSDLVLGFYPGMNFVYASVASHRADRLGAVFPGARRCAIGGAALASSVLFFVLTNFGMWLFSGIYPRTSAGLAACYVAAIPFFQNSVAGDLFYAALLFGGFALAERLRAADQDRGARAPPDRALRLQLFGPAPLKAPLNFRSLVGNQRLTQGK